METILDTGIDTILDIGSLLFSKRIFSLKWAWDGFCTFKSLPWYPKREKESTEVVSRRLYCVIVGIVTEWYDRTLFRWLWSQLIWWNITHTILLGSLGPIWIHEYKSDIAEFNGNAPLGQNVVWKFIGKRLSLRNNRKRIPGAPKILLLRMLKV